MPDPSSDARRRPARGLALLCAFSLTLVLAGPATAADGYRPRLEFKLTILGDAPKDAVFGLYLQTDPPTADQQTHYVICPAGGPEPIYTCASGETSILRLDMPRVADSSETTWVFRYDRHVGDLGGPMSWPREWESFYEGRVTLTVDRPAASFHMTYDYDLGMPNTAMAVVETPSRPPVLPVLGALLALFLGFAVARSSSRPR